MVQEFEKNLNPFVSISTLSANIVQLDNLPGMKFTFVNALLIINAIVVVSILSILKLVR